MVRPNLSEHRAVLGTLKATPARMVLYAAYQDPRPSEWLSRNAGLPAVKVPNTVGGTDGVPCRPGGARVVGLALGQVEPLPLARLVGARPPPHQPERPQPLGEQPHDLVVGA